MQQRRKFLQQCGLGLGALPLINLLGNSAWAAGEPHASEDDPMAMALGYKKVAEESADRSALGAAAETQFCDNCVQYVATSDDAGTCAVLPGKLVTAKGWCKVWVAMPPG